MKTKNNIEKSRKGRGQSFFGGVAVLFIGGMLAKILGAIFRVPLTWVLGAEGLGLYQLVFPVFSLLIVLASSGMPTSISKMVAERLSRGDNSSVKSVLKVSLITMSVVGAIFGILLAALSGVLSNLQGNEQSLLLYLGIAPAVLFVCILSVFRGYFQGFSNMVPTAVSQIVEQAGKLVFGLLGAYIGVQYGVVFGAFGAVLGVTISEILAVIVLCIIYLKNRKTAPNSAQSGVHSTSNMAIFRELLRTSLPIVLASITLPLIVMLDSFLVVNLLGRAGFSSVEATERWGLFSGVVNSLINMPIALCLAVAISIVPAVAALKDRRGAKAKINQAITICILICLPIMCVFLLYPENLVHLVYGDTLGGAEMIRLSATLLTLSSPIVVLGSVLQVQNSSLQGLGYGRITMINMLLSGAVKIAITWFTVQNPEINIFGCALSNLVFYAMAVLLNGAYLRFKLKIGYNYKNALSGVGGAVAVVLYSLNVVLLPISEIAKLLIGVLGSVLIYLFSLYVFGFKYKEYLPDFSKFGLKKRS